jgi:hypothetical protein
MNLFEYISYMLAGAFTDDYGEEVREDMKAQAKKRREEAKENEEE